MAYDKEELFKLPDEEKLDLVDALWESISEDFLEKRMSNNEIREELDRRIKNMDENPGSLIPWEEVKKKMNMG